MAMSIDIHGRKRPHQEEPVEVTQACQDATWTPPWGSVPGGGQPGWPASILGPSWRAGGRG